jgi:hypothetical protein
MADLAALLAAGGRSRIALLRYCVISMQLEPLFVYLAQEYRMRPTPAGAIALYDVFCRPDGPARLSAYSLLPPRELRLGAAIAELRAQPQSDDPAEQSDEAPPRPMASKALFDALDRGLRADSGGTWARVSRDYDSRLEPHQNLRGGRMSAAQRHFVDRVWAPVARPQLVAAGFWQIATIG